MDDFDMHVFDGDEADEFVNHSTNLKKNLIVVTLKSGIQVFLSEDGKKVDKNAL